MKYFCFFLIFTFVFTISSSCFSETPSIKIKCLTCGSLNEDFAKYCLHCGSNLNVNIGKSDLSENAKLHINYAGDELKKFSSFYYSGLILTYGGSAVMYSGVLSNSYLLFYIGFGSIIVGTVYSIIAPHYVGSAGNELKQVNNFTGFSIAYNDNKLSLNYCHSF